MHPASHFQKIILFPFRVAHQDFFQQHFPTKVHCNFHSAQPTGYNHPLFFR